MSIHANVENFRNNFKPVDLEVSTAGLIRDEHGNFKTADQIYLAADSGGKRGPIGHAGNNDEDQEEQEKKNREARKELLQAASITMQTIEYRGMKLDYTTFVTNLKEETKLDSTWKNLQGGFIEVKNEDMLRLDANGNRVDPKDDPEGKFIVKTLEEKRAYENRTNKDVMGLTQEEVTKLPDGRMVATKAFNESQRLDAKIKEQNGVLDDLANGKVKLENVDNHVKDTVVDRIQAKDAPLPQQDPALGNKPAQAAPQGGILGQLNNSPSLDANFNGPKGPSGFGMGG